MTIDPAAPFTRLPLFAHVDADGQRALRGVMTPRQVPAGETIFWIGEDGDTLFVIEEGRVSITAPDQRGDHLVLDTLGPGAMFGEISLLDAGPRTATARALTDVSLLALSRQDFHSVVRRHPDAAIDVLQAMGARQRSSTTALRGLPNPNDVIAEEATIWQRTSDLIAQVAASQAFSLVHLFWFGSWIFLNVLATAGLLPASFGFDPYPFGLLTLIVSLEAIFLSIFVLVSQNRQSERDRIRTDVDHQVNVKAHLEIMGIVNRLKRIEAAVTVPAETTARAPAE